MQPKRAVNFSKISTIYGEALDKKFWPSVKKLPISITLNTIEKLEDPIALG